MAKNFYSPTDAHAPSECIIIKLNSNETRKNGIRNKGN